MRRYNLHIADALLIIPCVLWIIFSLCICVVYNHKWYGYVAAAFPTIIVLASYTAAKKYCLFGGLLLFIQGLCISYIIIRYLPLQSALIYETLFALPIIVSGALYLSSEIANLHLYKTK